MTGLNMILLPSVQQIDYMCQINSNMLSYPNFLEQIISIILDFYFYFHNYEIINNDIMNARCYIDYYRIYNI